MQVATFVIHVSNEISQNILHSGTYDYKDVYNSVFSFSARQRLKTKSNWFLKLCFVYYTVVW